jgi:isochorismate synthase EntC
MTEALAGTRPRGASAEEDERLAAELMASEKDKFENQVTAEYIEEVR